MERLRQLLQQSGSDEQLALALLFMNLLVGAVIGLLLRAHYVRYGRSLSNRDHFASTFVPIILAVLLIISIIKASLALSLGLVGALSIVRFRTPVKEPEELVYLFLAIAAGIGLGANQTVAVSLAMLLILGILTVLARRPSRASPAHQFFEVIIDADGLDAEEALAKLSALIDAATSDAKLRRFEAHEGGLIASFSIRCSGVPALGALVQKIRGSWTNARVTSLDQDRNPGS